MRCDIDQFCCSSSMADFKTINTKQRPSQNNTSSFVYYPCICSSGFPLKFSHDDNCDDKI